jgi:hypothetical protein
LKLKTLQEIMNSNNSDAMRNVFDALNTVSLCAKDAHRLATQLGNTAPAQKWIDDLKTKVSEAEDALKVFNPAVERLTNNNLGNLIKGITALCEDAETVLGKIGSTRPVPKKERGELLERFKKIENYTTIGEKALFEGIALDELKEISTAIDFGTRNPIQVDGAGSGGPSGGGALTDRVDHALRGLLGRPLNRASAPVIRSALSAACTATRKEGHMDVSLNPHASITVGVRAGGGQPLPEANLASVAADLAEWAPALLEEIKPIKPDADTEIIGAWREQVKDGLEGLLEEMNRAEGVRKIRVKLFFEHLGIKLGPQIGWEPPAPNKAIALLNLRDALGIMDWEDPQRNVNTLLDEEEVAKFFKLQHGIEALAAAFNRFAGGAEKFLSSQLRSANRALVAVAEAARTLEKTLDSVQVGQAQRELLHFKSDKDLSLQGFLNWVENYAEHDAPAALEASGKKAKQSTLATLTELQRLAKLNWTQELLPQDAIPRHPRVTRAQDALEKALQSAWERVDAIK